MIQWGNFRREQIIRDRSLLLQFSQDYEKAFNRRLTIGCKKCIEKAYRELTQFIENSETNLNLKTMGKPEFRLHKKYEGMIWKNQPIRNSDLTLEVAQDLLKNHKRGAELFDIVPTAPLSVEERAAAISELTSVEAVESALEGERSKTVRKAGKAKIAELEE